MSKRMVKTILTGVILMSVIAMFCACKEEVGNSHKMTSSQIDKVTIGYQDKLENEFDTITIENVEVIQKLVEIYNNEIDGDIKIYLDEESDPPIPISRPMECPRLAINYYTNENIVMEIGLNQIFLTSRPLRAQILLNGELIYDEYYKIYLENK